MGGFLWVWVIGGAIAGLVAAASFLSTPAESDARVLVYGNASRGIAIRQTVVITMTLDAVAETRAQRRAPLRNVKLRLPRDLFKNFALVSLEPRPDEVTTTAGGRYFHYNEVARETTLDLRLYAIKPGRHRVRADFYADEHAPADYAVTISVRPTS